MATKNLSISENWCYVTANITTSIVGTISVEDDLLHIRLLKATTRQYQELTHVVDTDGLLELTPLIVSQAENNKRYPGTLGTKLNTALALSISEYKICELLAAKYGMLIDEMQVQSSKPLKTKARRRRIGKAKLKIEVSLSEIQKYLGQKMSTDALRQFKKRLVTKLSNCSLFKHRKANKDDFSSGITIKAGKLVVDPTKVYFTSNEIESPSSFRQIKNDSSLAATPDQSARERAEEIYERLRENCEDSILKHLAEMLRSHGKS